MTQRGKSEGFAPPALGGASLLVIFAVLALTVFALLSLSTVRADVRLGDATTRPTAGPRRSWRACGRGPRRRRTFW